jgi:two-component sensor histidine kinase/ligand-binding sensor domain-containing protein
LHFKHFYITLFLGILFTAGNLFSQSYNFETYNVEDGLPQSEVNHIYQDERGYLWIATSGGGMCSFDGLHFEQYEERNGLAGQIVTSITGDNLGNIWAATTWGGISKFDGKIFRTYNVDNGLVANSIECLYFDVSTSTIIAGSGFGISFIKDNRIKNLRVYNNDTLPAVISLFQSKGQIFAGTVNGLYIVTENSFTKVDNDFFNGKRVNNIISDQNENVWFAVSETGLVQLKKNGKDVYTRPDFNDLLKGYEVSSLFMDDRYGILIGTKERSLFIWNEKKLSHFNDENGLKAGTIKCITRDHSGKIWMGTSGNGLIGFYSRAFTYFSNFDGLGNGDIFSILVDDKKNVWAASYGTGVYCYDGVDVKLYDEKSGLINHAVRQMVEDNNGNIWMATKGGLAKFDGNRFTNYTVKDGLPDNNLRAVAIDNDGNIWVGTNGQGAAKFDGKKFTVYNEGNGLGHNYVHSILCDTKGNIWFGTGNGIDKMNKGSFMHYSTEDGLCNSYVGSILEDRLGNIWLATDRCVSKFTGAKFKNYSVEQGLASSTIYLIQFDEKGDLWVGTNKGLDKLDFDTYGSVTSVKHYGKAEGFIGVECNARSVTKDSQGNLWFGTVKGIIRYIPGEDIKNIEAPKIHLTGIKLFYKVANWKALGIETAGWFDLPVNPNFRYDQNQLMFEFTAISNILPEKNTYSYILEGFDEDWSPFSKASSVSYSNLPPGNYTFKVRSKNCDGIISEKDAEFHFTIAPAFWQTWWFYSLILLGIVYIVYKYNSTLRRQASIHNNLLEQRVEMRTREIMRQKEEKDVLLKEVHHRVKNNMQVITSLLNIQSFYIKDPESLKLIAESKNRIKSMALIHEKLYESKEFTKISISDYVDSLLSELISAYGINQEIVLEKNITAGNFSIDTVIPLGLLINEVISNSLKYAFVNREVGNIFIELSQHGDNYHMVIGDDGIGIPKDSLQKESSTLGLELIKLLSDQLNGEVKLQDRPGTYFEVIFKGNEIK